MLSVIILIVFMAHHHAPLLTSGLLECKMHDHLLMHYYLRLHEPVEYEVGELEF